MRTLDYTKSMWACVAGLALVATGCSTDDKYDLDNTDFLLGFGSEGLALPTCSTKDIKVDEFLEESETVVILENGDYVFQQKGGDVAPTKINVPVITTDAISMAGCNIDLPVTPTGNARLNATGEGVVDVHVDAYEFAYNGSIPQEIKELVKLDVESNLSLDLEIPEKVGESFSMIDTIRLVLPDFLAKLDIHVDGVTPRREGNVLEFLSVPTEQASKISILIPLTELQNDSEGIYVDWENHTIAVKGTVSARVYVMPEHVKANYVSGARALNDADVPQLIASGTFEEMTITKVTGYFNPEFDLKDLGKAEIKDLPEFLQDEEVVLDIANPQINLTFVSDLCATGLVSGTLKAVKEGKVISTIQIPELNVRKNTTTQICLCRNKSLLEEKAGVEYVEIANLSDIIRTIPDEITFDAKAAVKSDEQVEYELGHDYTVQPSYDIVAPLAFGKDASIVYSDTFDDWNGSLEEIALSDGGYVELKANMTNGLPIDLKVEADAIGKDGKELSSVNVIVTDIIKGSATTEVTIRIEAKDSDNLKKLDGIKLKATGTSSEQLQGIVLNAKKHALKASDITVKVCGKIIYDAN